MENRSYFHDPIYGHIFLTPIELALVDSLEFQRLRYIRQNSLLHYVFPGAFHSRFSHSLGVCHNAYRILNQIFPSVEKQSDHYCLQVVRIACLLHDVGHGAFSHLLPTVQLKEKSFLPTLREVFDHPELWNLANSIDDPITQGILDYFEEDLDGPIEHEALSLLILKQMFQHIANSKNQSSSELLGDISPAIWAQDVSAMILYTVPTSSHFDESSMRLIQSLKDQLARTENSKTYRH
ncbi:MAG: HD domain-containing protein [Bdellovibrionales bacterium]